MALFFRFLSISALFMFSSSPVTAATLNRPESQLSFVPADSLPKYSTLYFLDHALFFPPTGTCLFYTANLTWTAQQYAKSRKDKLTTIWDLWPCEYYNNATVADNRLRDIMADPAQRYRYFEKMSEAFAQLCNNSATVLTQDTNRIPRDGIWARIEEPALKLINNVGGRVDEIAACTEDGGGRTGIWHRPFGGRLMGDQLKTSSGISKRQTVEAPQQACYSQTHLHEMFGDIPW